MNGNHNSSSNMWSLLFPAGDELGVGRTNLACCPQMLVLLHLQTSEEARQNLSCTCLPHDQLEKLLLLTTALIVVTIA